MRPPSISAPPTPSAMSTMMKSSPSERAPSSPSASVRTSCTRPTGADQICRRIQGRSACSDQCRLGDSSTRPARSSTTPGVLTMTAQGRLTWIFSALCDHLLLPGVGARRRLELDLPAFHARAATAAGPRRASVSTPRSTTTKRERLVARRSCLPGRPTLGRPPSISLISSTTPACIRSSMILPVVGLLMPVALASSARLAALRPSNCPSRAAWFASLRFAGTADTGCKLCPSLARFAIGLGGGRLLIR